MLLLDCAGIAAKAGLHFARQTMADHDAIGGVADERPHLSALLFRDLDGKRRAVPLDIIDRVELASSQAVRVSAGQLRLSVDDGIVPLAGVEGAAELVAARDEIAVLRLADGRAEISYAIAEALDIVTIAEAMVPSRIAGPIAGVCLFNAAHLHSSCYTLSLSQAGGAG